MVPPAHVLARWPGLSFREPVLLHCASKGPLQLGSFFERLDVMASYPNMLRNAM